MLFKGYAEAVRSIRKRKGWTQQKCADQATAATGTKIDDKAWSKYETGAVKLGDSHLPVIRAGLQVSETELWQESVREQRKHYYGRADEVREEAAEYGAPMAASLLQGIWAMNAKALPASEERRFSAERNALATALTSLLALVDNLVDKYLELTKARRRQ